MGERTARNKLTMFLILVVSFATISSSATFYILSPRPSQSFMSFGVYSQSGLSQYLPASNSTVTLGQDVNWTIIVTNYMGSPQLVMLVARIGNSSLTPLNLPNTSNCSPSANGTKPATCFPQTMSTNRFLGNGETSRFNFNWIPESVTNQSGRLLLSLRENGENVSSSPVGAGSGGSFRWIFELWTFNQECNDPTALSCYHYGFGPQNSSTGLWLQIWFNIQA